MREARDVGIIDWGLAHAGDPLWDIARVSLWDGPGAQAALLDGYGHDAGAPGADRPWKPLTATVGAHSLTRESGQVNRIT